ncbi:MAG: hypothetical protein U0002_11240 [Thermoanaerobaculia bacterium]
MSRLQPLLLTLGLAVAVALPAAADSSQTFSGSNAGGPLWNRPVEDGPTIRAPEQVHYSAQRFNLPENATCRIYSTQDFDGYIHLYRGGFNPASPLTNLVGGDDDDTSTAAVPGLGIGTSRLPDPATDAEGNPEPNLVLTAGDYVLVTSGFNNGAQGSFTNYIQCNTTQPVQGVCFFTGFPRENQVCLQNRFAVRIINVTNLPSGRATPVRFGSSDSAFFWFFGDQNYEAVVKVLDACVLNNRFWVFAAGLTDQGYTIQVGDAVGGTIKTYSNTLGQRAPATTDTNAFPCL